MVTVIFSLCFTVPKPPCWKTLYLWFCGLSPSPTSTLSQEERAALERRLTSIEEKPLWKAVCNVNALLLLTINVFLWGYFGWDGVGQCMALVYYRSSHPHVWAGDFGWQILLMVPMCLGMALPQGTACWKCLLSQGLTKTQTWLQTGYMRKHMGANRAGVSFRAEPNLTGNKCLESLEPYSSHATWLPHCFRGRTSGLHYCGGGGWSTSCRLLHDQIEMGSGCNHWISDNPGSCSYPKPTLDNLPSPHPILAADRPPPAPGLSLFTPGWILPLTALPAIKVP